MFPLIMIAGLVTIWGIAAIFCMCSSSEIAQETYIKLALFSTLLFVLLTTIIFFLTS